MVINICPKIFNHFGCRMEFLRQDFHLQIMNKEKISKVSSAFSCIFHTVYSCLGKQINIDV